jgi:AraC-like DNA-binding protein
MGEADDGKSSIIQLLPSSSEQRYNRRGVRSCAVIGMPPAELIRCKIASAQRLLVESDVTITRVAMSLNFASSQYFATDFRRITRQRPSVPRHSRADDLSGSRARTVR